MQIQLRRGSECMGNSRKEAKTHANPVRSQRQMHGKREKPRTLMGQHLGMHIPVMTAGLKPKGFSKAILACVFTCVGGVGLWLFLKNGMPNYLFFRVPFAFLDYDKAGWLVFLENLLMLLFWAFVGTQVALICRNLGAHAEKKKNPLIPVLAIMAAVIIGIVLIHVFPSSDEQDPFGSTAWSAPMAAEGLDKA